MSPSIILRRALAVELASSLRDVGMATDPGRYLTLVAGPGLGDASAGLATQVSYRDKDLGQVSGCGLVVRGMWRELGIVHPILQHPYRIGRAVSDLVEIAAEARALRRPHEALLYLKNGDVFVVGGPGAGGPEHVWTVLDATANGYPSDGVALLNGLDGGQRDDNGRQVIRVMPHDISPDPLLRLNDGARRVRWVIDYGAVWSCFGVERPDV